MKIKNLEIEEGVQNWTNENGVESGAIDVRLPNGTFVTIQASVKGDWNSCHIQIHRLRDTEITVFHHGTKLTKRMERYDKETTWTTINTKEE